MALELNPANSYSWPVRAGDLFGGVNEAFNFANATVPARANTISNDYLTFAQQGEVIDDLYTQARDVASDLGTFAEYLFGLAEKTLERMCLDDSARPRSDDVPGRFDKLDRDMRAADRKWTIPTVTGTVAVPGTNIGTGYLIGSVVEPVDGQTCYYAYAEVLRCEITADSYENSTDAGAEELTVYGETAAPSLRDALWPKGSGATTTLTVVNTDTDEILADGGLEDWTVVSGSNYRPTEWSLFGSTTSGTHINRNAATVYGDGGTYSCKLTGDGAVVVGIYQALDQDVVKSNTNYALSFWYQTDSGTFTAKLRVALTDGSGTVITDNASTSQSDLTVDETALGAANGTWTRATMVLRTPRNLPTELRLEFRFPAGDLLDSGKSLFLDHVVMSEMTQVYDGGPYLACHAGATAFANKDAFTYTVANTGDETTFVGCLNRTFDLAGNGIRLTVTGTTAISDALIA